MTHVLTTFNVLGKNSNKVSTPLILCPSNFLKRKSDLLIYYSEPKFGFVPT